MIKTFQVIHEQYHNSVCVCSDSDSPGQSDHYEAIMSGHIRKLLINVQPTDDANTTVVTKE